MNNRVNDYIFVANSTHPIVEFPDRRNGIVRTPQGVVEFSRNYNDYEKRAKEPYIRFSFIRDGKHYERWIHSDREYTVKHVATLARRFVEEII